MVRYLNALGDSLLLLLAIDGCLGYGSLLGVFLVLSALRQLGRSQLVLLHPLLCYLLLANLFLLGFNNAVRHIFLTRKGRRGRDW